MSEKKKVIRPLFFIYFISVLKLNTIEKTYYLHKSIKDKAEGLIL